MKSANVVLRIKTAARIHGKVAWMFWWKGHQKISTNPDFLTTGIGWDVLAEAGGNNYKIKTILDDGRAAAFIRNEKRGGRLL